LATSANAPENGKNLIDSINLAYSENVNMVNVFSTFTLEGNSFPTLDMLNNNKEYLLSLAIETAVPKSEFYKPEYTSSRIYGTSSLWYLLLFLNEMYTAMDYTKNVILVIPQSNLSTYNTFVQNFGKKDYVFDDLTITVIPEGE
jgi:hypothetical protein